jgi:hypothetical protein
MVAPWVVDPPCRKPTWTPSGAAAKPQALPLAAIPE